MIRWKHRYRSLAISFAAWRGRDTLFAHIYRSNIWKDGQSRSGPGSHRASAQVADTLAALDHVVARYAIGSIDDIPCGDGNWIDLFLDRHPGMAYHGFDIVGELIERNRLAMPGRRFTRLDIVESVPPRCDLILCKDLLNHLTYDEIDRAIANMRQSGATWLLASNNFGSANADLKRYGSLRSRLIDIGGDPLRYPPPVWRQGYIGLWRLEGMVSRPR